MSRTSRRRVGRRKAAKQKKKQNLQRVPPDGALQVLLAKLLIVQVILQITLDVLSQWLGGCGPF